MDLQNIKQKDFDNLSIKEFQRTIIELIVAAWNKELGGVDIRRVDNTIIVSVSYPEFPIGYGEFFYDLEAHAQKEEATP